MEMNEMLLLAALKQKRIFERGSSHDLVENFPELKGSLRNICALITPDLFSDVEGLSSVLDMSKREFVEMALYAAVAEAKKVLDQTGVTELMGLEVSTC